MEKQKTKTKCACVCACVHACVCVCVHACVCWWGGVGEGGCDMFLVFSQTINGRRGMLLHWIVLSQSVCCYCCCFFTLFCFIFVGVFCVWLFYLIFRLFCFVVVFVFNLTIKAKHWSKQFSSLLYHSHYPQH